MERYEVKLIYKALPTGKPGSIVYLSSTLEKAMSDFRFLVSSVDSSVDRVTLIDLINGNIISKYVYHD